MKKTSKYIKNYVIALFVFIAAAAVFYFAADEQLYFRQSAGTIKEIEPNQVTGEILNGITVEQYFTADFDYLDQIGVMLSDYDKELTSDIRIELYDTRSGALIAETLILPEFLGINQYYYMSIGGAGIPRGSLLRLVITSDTGTAENAATALYNSTTVIEGGKLSINGTISPGTLCFSAEGRDFVWTGEHYLQIMAVIGAFLTSAFIYSAFRFNRGKGDLIFTTAAAFKKYGFLISQLVSRDFKVRYKRSFLGVLWSLLNPLLTMMVQYIVFSQLFRADIDNFPIYMLTGLVIFNFFSEAVGQSLGAIVWNASLITKVYVPKYMYPVTKVLSSTINFFLSMIPILIGMIITGEPFTKAMLLLPFVMACVIAFTMGLSMLLSALMVFFRDIQFLWGIVSMLWMYLTALFYPANIIPANIHWVLDFNPMYCYVTFARTIIMDGISPEPRVYIFCILYATGSLLVGGIVFKKLQDRFVLNL